MLDAVFIHANSAPQVYQSLHREHSAIEPPIWAGMLAAHCRKQGFQVAVVDCEADRLGPDDCTALVREVLKPRLAIFVVYGQQPSASTQNMDGAAAYCEHLKNHEPTLKTVFVGAHVAAVPGEVLSFAHVDFVCQNEGVYTIRDLLTVDDLGDASLLRLVNGLGWKEDGRQILNPIGGSVPQERLEHDLPGVAWDLLPPLSRYRTAGWHSWPNGSVKSPFASLYTSLGCPFTCDFCMINIINRTEQGDHVSAKDSAAFRYWPPEFIIKQFDHFAANGVKNVKIADELFVLKERHFLEVCKLIVERQYRFNIWCYARVDTCKPQWLDALKKAGVNFIGLGIESPDQTVRKNVIKGGYQEVKIGEIIKSVQEAGIAVGANYIVGLPKDTASSIKYNRDFARTHLAENYNIYSAMAYPGSPLYVKAKAAGIVLPDRYAGYSQHSYWTQNLPSETLSAAEILGARDAAWTDYFSDPAYQNFLRGRFGQAAVDNVQATLGTRLQRKLLGDPEPA